MGKHEAIDAGWKAQTWEQGHLVHNLNRGRDRKPVFARIVKDPNPQYMPLSGRRVLYPCLLTAVFRG